MNGEVIEAENFYQLAEHYFRVMRDAELGEGRWRLEKSFSSIYGKC